MRRFLQASYLLKHQRPSFLEANSKKIAVVVFLFLLFAYSHYFQSVVAATPNCGGIQVDVVNSQVSISALGCTQDGRYLIEIKDSTGAIITRNEVIVTGGFSNTSVFFINNLGQYTANLLLVGSSIVILSQPFEITTLSPQPLCGDAVSPAFSGCPTTCPATPCLGGSQWFCLENIVDCPVIPPAPSPMPWHICDQLQASSKSRTNCLSCFQSSGIWTAVGCIPVEPESMIKTLIRIGLLVGGGVSFIIILAGSFILSTSKGEPKKITEAKEMITSALIGLVFIIFSVSILQLIGVQILHIPDFGI